MGIPVDPYKDDFCPWDHFFWPPGQTPLVHRVTVSGVEKGSEWTPEHGEPPNGKYVLLQIPGSTDVWISPEPRYAQHHISTEYQYLTIWSSTGMGAFLYIEPGVNFVDLPNRYSGTFEGGVANITFPNIIFPGQSLQSIARKIGLHPEPKTFAEIFRLEPEHATIRYAKQKDGSCIYVKLVPQ